MRCKQTGRQEETVHLIRSNSLFFKLVDIDLLLMFHFTCVRVLSFDEMSVFSSLS